MIFKSDKVVLCDIGFGPEAGVSGPILLQTDNHTFLTFNAVKMMPNGKWGTSGTGVIEFIGCILSKFGYPNDEALPGHPLYSRGLKYYGVFEVLKSSWIQQMTEQNRICFPQTKDSTRRHFIFTFHDSTFECVADDLRASLSTETYDKIHAQICQRAFGSE